MLDQLRRAAAVSARVHRWLCLLAAICSTVVLLFPIYWMLMTAVMPTTDILSRNPPLVPDVGRVSFGAFAAVVQRRPFLQWTANSLLVGVASAAISLFAATLAGYSLSRWWFRGVRAVGSALLLGKLAPPSLIIIPLFIMFNTVGLIDSYTGLILANVATGVPLATWLMKGFFDRIPFEIEQAAMIDGCSRLGALRQVVLPLVQPGLASCAVYLLLVSWSRICIRPDADDEPKPPRAHRRLAELCRGIPGGLATTDGGGNAHVGPDHRAVRAAGALAGQRLDQGALAN